MCGGGAEQRVRTITDKGVPVTAYTSEGDTKNFKSNMKIADIVEVNIIDDEWHEDMDKRVLKADKDGDNRNDMFEDIPEREAETAEKWIYNGDDDSNTTAQNEEPTKKNDAD